MLQQSMASRDAAAVFGHMLGRYAIGSFSGFWGHISRYVTNQICIANCGNIEHNVRGAGTLCPQARQAWSSFAILDENVTSIEQRHMSV